MRKRKERKGNGYHAWSILSAGLPTGGFSRSLLAFHFHRWWAYLRTRSAVVFVFYIDEPSSPPNQKAVVQRVAFISLPLRVNAIEVSQKRLLNVAACSSTKGHKMPKRELAGFT